jgi:Amt family ammonium transporter
VHITSGVAALICARVLGRRLGYGIEPMEPHNVALTLLGTGMLWFGWFGFNAGSALAANGLAASAFVTTHLAAAMAALAWCGAAWARHGRASVLGASAGAVAGLVGITPAAGFVTPLGALVIGLAAGSICFVVVEFLMRGRVDDSLDVFGVHGVGGMIGALLTGVLATKAVNPAGADGALYGNLTQLGVQALAVVVVGLYSAVVTWGLLKLVNVVVGLRVSPQEELRGLDASQHGEAAYRGASY